MKKTLIIISILVVLVGGIIPLVGCGGGTELSESDLATIRGFSTRLDAHDSAIATIQNTIAAMDTDTLNKLAALDADKLTALLNLDTAAMTSGLTALETWKTDAESRMSSAESRLTALEADNGGGGSTNPSGEVTVVLDTAEVPFLFTSTTTSQVLPVKITNGTSDYQEVKFNVTLQCVSTDGVAAITAGPAVAINTVGMAITYVPTEVLPTTNTQLIYATWIGSKVLVAPGKETTVYIYITAFTTSTSEVWQATLSGIVATKL